MTRAIRAFYLTLIILGSFALIGVGALVDSGEVQELQEVSVVMFVAGISSILGGFFTAGIHRALERRV